MTIQQFGDAFKQAIEEELTAGRLAPERAARIYPRNWTISGDNTKQDGINRMLEIGNYAVGQPGDARYNYPAVNNAGGSVEIDKWWGIFQGLQNIHGDTVGTQLPAEFNNQANVNIGGAAAGNVALPNIDVNIRHGAEGAMPWRLNLTATPNEDWRTGNVDHRQAGYLLGQLFVLGYEATEIWRGPTHNLRTRQIDNVASVNGLAAIRAYARTNFWRAAFVAQNNHTVVGIAPDAYIVGVMGADVRPNLVNTTPADQAIIDRWLSRQSELAILFAHRFSAPECQELHRLGYDPKDLYNAGTVGGTAGHIRVKDFAGVANAYFEDFINIAAHSKFAGWNNAFVAQNNHTVVGIAPDAYIVGVMGADVRPNLDNTNAADQAIIKNWLQKQIDLEIDPNRRFSAPECQELHRLGYDPKDLYNAGTVGGTAGHIRVKDFAGVANAYFEDFINIAAHSKFAGWNNAFVAQNNHTVVGIAPDAYIVGVMGADVRPNLDNTNAADQAIIKNWLQKQIDLEIDPNRRFSAPECQELHRLGYDPKDLYNAGTVGGTAGHIRVKDFAGVANAYFEDFINIAAHSKFAGWNNAFVAQNNHTVVGIAPDAYIVGVMGADVRPNLDNTNAADQAIIKNWLQKQIDLEIDPNRRFSAPECQELHRLGYDPKDLYNAGTVGGTAGHIRVKDFAGVANAYFEDFINIAAHSKFAGWNNAFVAQNNHTVVGIAPDAYIVGVMGADVRPNLDNTNAADQAIIKNWLQKQIDLEIDPNRRFSAPECQELHRLGYDPKDLYNAGTVGGTAGHIRVKDFAGVANAYFEDFINIAAHSKFAGWNNAFVAQNNHTVVGIAPDAYIVGVMGADVRPNLDNTNAADQAIIKNWLQKQIDLEIDPNRRFSAPECQELHRLGYDPKDLYNAGTVGGTAGHIRVKDFAGVANAYFEDFINIAAHSKFAGWNNAFVAQNNHTVVGIAPDAYIVGVMGADVRPNLDNTNAADQAIIKNWLQKQIDLEIDPNRRFSAPECQELHRLGYDPKDLYNAGTVGGTAGHIRVKDFAGVANAYFEDFINIAAHSKFAGWNNAFVAQNNHTVVGIAPDAYIVGVMGADVRPNLDNTNAADQAIIKNWLQKQIDLEIDPNRRFSAPECQELHRLGYDPKDLYNAGTVGGTAGHIRVKDFAGVANAYFEDFINIAAHSKFAGWRAAVIAHTADPTSPSVGPYKPALIAGNQTIIDDWLNRQVTIGLTTRLTPAQCQELHRLGWSPADITNVAGVANGVDLDNSGTLLVGFAGIRTKNKFVVAGFKADFRTEAKRVHDAAGATAAAKKAHTELNATNGTKGNDKDFIIDQFNHIGITAADAVAAYNNGWIYGSEIRINAGNKEVSTDGGANWIVKPDLTTAANSRTAIKNAITGADATAIALLKNKMEAYQGFKISSASPFELWRPELDEVTEKALIRNAAGQPALNKQIQDIGFARYRTAVRATLTAAGGAAATELATGATDADRKINDFLFHGFIDPAMVARIYNAGWVYGSEIKVVNNKLLFYCIDGDWKKNSSWKDLVDLAVIKTRTSVLALIDATAQAKADAYQCSAPDVRWVKPLNEAERKYLRDAANEADVGTRRDEIALPINKTFFDDFTAATGASKNASYVDVKSYRDIVMSKGLDGTQAAALYNAPTRVPASELTGIANGVINYTGVDGQSKPYDLKTAAGITAYLAAKKEVKDAADLTTKKGTVKAEIQTEADKEPIDEPNAKKVGDPEIKTELNKATPKPIADNETWKTYIDNADKDNLDARKQKVLDAISAIRTERKKTDYTAVWNTMIREVEDYWTSKLGKGAAEKKIDGKTIDEVLIAGWKTKPTANTEIDSPTKIAAKKKILTDKIDAARKKEDDSAPITAADIQNKFAAKIAPGVTIDAEAAKSYAEVKESDNALIKTVDDLTKLVEEGKINSTKKDAFVTKTLKDLGVTGKNNNEKYDNFFKAKKAETVIRAVIRFRLDDDATYLKKAEETIKANEKSGDQELSIETYPKENGKYTKAALENFLYHQQVGKAYKYVNAEDDKKKEEQTPSKPWWKAAGYWPFWVTPLVAGGVAVWYYWDKITGPGEEDDDLEKAEE